jgi:hypothetical protein
MTSQLNRKAKAVRKRYGPRRWIVDWTIEPASESSHVSLSLFVADEPDDSVGVTTTRHYVMQPERMVDLIRELTGALEHSHASRALEQQALEQQALGVSSHGSAEHDSKSDAAEKDAPEASSHFFLGAYGLVGN